MENFIPLTCTPPVSVSIRISAHPTSPCARSRPQAVAAPPRLQRSAESLATPATLCIHTHEYSPSRRTARPIHPPKIEASNRPRLRVAHYRFDARDLHERHSVYSQIAISPTPSRIPRSFRSRKQIIKSKTIFPGQRCPDRTKVHCRTRSYSTNPQTPRAEFQEPTNIRTLVMSTYDHPAQPSEIHLPTSTFYALDRPGQRCPDGSTCT